MQIDTSEFTKLCDFQTATEPIPRSEWLAPNYFNRNAAYVGWDLHHSDTVRQNLYSASCTGVSESDNLKDELRRLTESPAIRYLMDFDAQSNSITIRAQSYNDDLRQNQPQINDEKHLLEHLDNIFDMAMQEAGGDS